MQHKDTFKNASFVPKYMYLSGWFLEVWTKYKDVSAKILKHDARKNSG